MKENLPSQIVESIKADASEWALKDAKEHGETMATNSALNRGYIAGRQEQLVKDLEFAEWVEDNYCRGIEKKWFHNSDAMKFEKEKTFYTTLELYSLYINQKK